MFDVRYQLRLNDLYDFSSTSIVNYDVVLRHLDFLDHILVGEKPMRFNQHENKLYVDMDWKNDLQGWIKVLRKVIRIRGKPKYAQWLWNFGWQMGRLLGRLVVHEGRRLQRVVFQQAQSGLDHGMLAVGIARSV